jgi:hypothetical protein
MSVILPFVFLFFWAPVRHAQAEWYRMCLGDASRQLFSGLSYAGWVEASKILVDRFDSRRA